MFQLSINSSCFFMLSFAISALICLYGYKKVAEINFVLTTDINLYCFI